VDKCTGYAVGEQSLPPDAQGTLIGLWERWSDGEVPKFVTVSNLSAAAATAAGPTAALWSPPMIWCLSLALFPLWELPMLAVLSTLFMPPVPPAPSTSTMEAATSNPLSPAIALNSQESVSPQVSLLPPGSLVTLLLVSPSFQMKLVTTF
jgi:hypothetical protein